MTAQYHPFLATTKYQRTSGHVWGWVCVLNLWTWISWRNVLRKKSGQFWAEKHRNVDWSTEGKKHSKTNTSEAIFFQKTFCGSCPLASPAAVSAARWQGPNGSHLRQPGNGPSAETMGQFSQALAGVLRGAESFGGAALSFLSRQLRTKFRHQDRLSAQSLPPEGSFESGVWEPLSGGRSPTSLACRRPCMVVGHSSPPTLPLSLQKHKDSWWVFFFFCFKKLPTKSSECRRMEIAEEWEPGVLGILPWLCLRSNDLG